MRKFLLAAVAVAAISSPALARDNSPYVGIEAGVAMSEEDFFDVDFDGDEFHSGLNVDYKLGLDADLIGGYDFGMFRAEAEVAYKRLGIEDLTVSGPLLGAIGGVDNDDFEVDGHASVLSLMGNALLDFGADEGIGAYIGGGIGHARVKMLGDRDSGLALQAIAGIRTPVSDQIDLGLKYRYFRSGKLEFSDDFVDAAGAPFTVAVDGRLKTHSLLLSLIYNFAAPPPPPEPVVAPPPPPPPPPPPATQTCPDGSVILATDVCPAPPPPPPPPPPEPERG
jgi:opacity protein-like surface antigen